MYMQLEELLSTIDPEITITILDSENNVVIQTTKVKNIKYRDIVECLGCSVKLFDIAPSTNKFHNGFVVTAYLNTTLDDLYDYDTCDDSESE